MATSTKYDIESLPALEDHIEITDYFYVDGGGFGDILKGLRKADRISVAVKVIRKAHTETNGEEEKQKIKSFARQRRIWEGLKHENVLRLIGVYLWKEKRVTLVSPFCEEGNILDHLSKNKSSDRMRFITDVANGLDYLHGKKVVHGDLKARNIVVHGRKCTEGIVWIAQLADFGISRVIQQKGDTTALVGNARYLAPELMDPEVDELDTRLLSTASDVYGFGMVMLEILTERKPFVDISDLKIISYRVSTMTKIQPSRERYSQEYLTDERWALMKKCWEFSPSDRCAIQDLLKSLPNCT